MPISNLKQQEVFGVDGLGHADVIPHGHEEGGHALFEADMSVTTDFIVIDISDTTNYPHDNTLWVHFANLVIDIDASVSPAANYNLVLGFLENVDATNGDFYPIYKWNGSKTTASNIREVIATNPENVKARSASHVGSGASLNDTAFQTDVNLATTRDPATADTPSGDGDIVLRATITAGSIDVTMGIVYHSHAT